MVIERMFVYHFVDPDLRVNLWFKKERTAKNGGVDFEIGDIGTSAQGYWRLKKISFRACLLFITFFVTKNYAVDMSRSAGRKVFLFSWERLWRSLQENIVSSKAVPEVLHLKYRSELKHDFTNRGCLHCAILKVLHGFREKRSSQVNGLQFFLQNVQNELFKMFKNNRKFTRTACCINSKIRNRDRNNTLVIFLFYCFRFEHQRQHDLFC